MPGLSRRLILRLATAVVALAAPAARAGTVSGIALAGPEGRVLYAAPPHPRATVVMLPGGSGDIGLEPDGTPRHGDNFVVRTRAAWVAKGYAVLIPDAPGGVSLRGRRSTPRYAAIVGGLIELAHQRSAAPVFLLGTSQGAIAAMNGAAHAAPGMLAGLVLSESVSRLGGSGETVFDADPGAVSVPTLIVANRDDQCGVAPPGDAPRIAAAMTDAPVRILTVSGGVNRSDNACGSLSPHGYDGIEPLVIDAVAEWMRRAGARSPNAPRPMRPPHRPT